MYIPSSVPNPKVVKCLLFISFVPIREDFRAKKLKRKGKKRQLLLKCCYH